ncbi:MAG TPA: ABC transporter substrate-binding protein [Candidatus Acidoferrales bacterium]|nr:ABC transporter substrate-binding protein [Candidatus Acidoferrales bacterium]
MRRIFSTRLIPSSLVLALVLCALAATAARRPRYGGTLTVELEGCVTSLDPTQLQPGLENQIAQDHLLTLIADRLVTLDEHGRPQPSLAKYWQHDADSKHWELFLGPNTKFQDGSPVSADAIVSSLRASNPDWKIDEGSWTHDLYSKSVIATVIEKTVTIEFDVPQPDLLYILAEPRNSILLRKSFGAVVGTGPFRITTWEPGQHAVLTANDDYWGGRPFLDSIDIQMRRAARDRMMDLDLGKSDVVEVSPESARLAAARGSRISASDPSELLAVVFMRASAAAKDIRLRQALSLAIDRASLVNFVLQKEGEPASALLPQWSTGYAFLFSAQTDPVAAQKLAAQISPAPVLKLGYDSADALERMIAERIVVNAQAAGISIAAQPLANDLPANAPAVDARLLRLPMSSPDPGVALENYIQLFAPLADLDASLTAPLDNPADPNSLYARERAILDTDEIIPLVHLPQVAGLSPRVRDWTTSRLGGWRLADVWLDGAPQ